MATSVNLGQYGGPASLRAPAPIYGTPLADPVNYNVTTGANLALLTGARLLRLVLPSDTNALYAKTGPSGLSNLTAGTGALILPGTEYALVVGETDGVRHTHLYWVNAA